MVIVGYEGWPNPYAAKHAACHWPATVVSALPPVFQEPTVFQQPGAPVAGGATGNVEEENGIGPIPYHGIPMYEGMEYMAAPDPDPDPDADADAEGAIPVEGKSGVMGVNSFNGPGASTAR